MRDRAFGPALLPQAAFVALVDRHQARLHAFVQGVVGQPEQAHDLVQDTFYQAWCAAQSATLPFVAEATDDERVRWLWRAAYHNAISALRRHRLIRWESLDDISEPPAQGDPGRLTFEDLVVESDALGAALAELPPPDVACLILRIVQGFSAAEVGQIVGATPEVVTKRLSRARQRLRAAYQHHTAQPEEQHRR